MTQGSVFQARQEIDAQIGDFGLFYVDPLHDRPAEQPPREQTL
ncbi:MAG TPA: hypothetical protein VKB88_17245 [Bryobacteraceae bacterium]|nr:hypothetical protein [Bryobacteraceae bacterium]